MNTPEYVWGRYEGGGIADSAPPPRPMFGAPPETAANLHPFKVRNASTGGVAKVRVRFGQVNNVTPDNVDTAITVATGDVYLDCTVDGDGQVTAVTISNGTVPADTATHAYKVLATVTASGGNVTVINQSVTHSLGHQMCGEDVHNFWGV